MTSSPVAIGEVFAGKYRIEALLGEGGMGVVMRAHHLELDQPVAVKFLLGDLSSDAEGEERFRREARAAAKIQSDHVVRVLDVGVVEGGPRYMVMECLEGRDLAEEMRKEGRLPLEDACAYMLQTIDAIAQAHAVGIVHRDLKPANVYLSRRSDDRVRVKVLDFGISKSLGATTTEQLSLTKTSAWIGSPLYMSPEQMQSARDVDSRADVWSLGAIFYEMLVGEPPYVADSLPQLCNLLITTDPRPIEERVPDIPEDLAAAIMGCLRREKDARTASVVELADVVQRYAPLVGSGTGSGLHARSAMLSSSGGSHHPSEAAQRTVVSAGEEEPIGETASAWEGSKTSSGDSSRLLWLVAGFVSLAAVVGLVIVLSSRSDDPVEPPLTAQPAVEVTPEPQEIPAVEDEKVTDLAPVDGAPSEPTAAEAAPEEPAAEPSASARPTPAPQPVVRPRPSAVKKPAAAPAPTPEPEPTTAPASSGDGLDDFGGRR